MNFYTVPSNHFACMQTWQAIVVSGIVALIAISVSIFIAPAASEANPSGQLPDDINPADVAWTLAATSLQLLLTPGVKEWPKKWPNNNNLIKAYEPKHKFY